MDVFGFGGSKKSGKRTNIEVNSGPTVQEDAILTADPARYDNESDMNRGEHYVRQRRRSRYFIPRII